MEIQNLDVYKLIPYENNPRKNDDAVPYVKESIRQFGFKVPIVIDKDNIVVCGHTRLKAAMELGLKEVPCVIADDLDKEQIKAFRLADNKVSEKAKWDIEALDLELDEILSIDMEDFGFDVFGDLEDSNSYFGDERERTINSYNLHEVDLSRTAGKWNMPIIKATQHIPDDLISFNYVLSTKQYDKGVHFYIDDYQFERIWNAPEDYIEKIMPFDCMLTPDFSLYTEMPLAMQMWNVFRSRLIGQIYQDAGITVIPTLQWCRKESFDFCFDGLQPNGVVSVSTIGVKREEEASKLWFEGMDEAMKRLTPSHVIVYGGDIGYKFECPVTYIANHNSERFKE